MKALLLAIIFSLLVSGCNSDSPSRAKGAKDPPQLTSRDLPIVEFVLEPLDIGEHHLYYSQLSNECRVVATFPPGATPCMLKLVDAKDGTVVGSAWAPADSSKDRTADVTTGHRGSFEIQIPSQARIAIFEKDLPTNRDRTLVHLYSGEASGSFKTPLMSIDPSTRLSVGAGSDKEQHQSGAISIADGSGIVSGEKRISVENGSRELLNFKDLPRTFRVLVSWPGNGPIDVNVSAWL